MDFIIRGTDHLLQKHFNRRLADERVPILDPATGTGTFVTNLISYLAEDGGGGPSAPGAQVPHEIHANEVAILPYYIANLNIEYTYREQAGPLPGSFPTWSSWTPWTHGLARGNGWRGSAAGSHGLWRDL